MTSRRSLLKVFTSLFSKSDRPSNARSVGRRAHAAKHLLRRVLFCQAFFFAPLLPKKKAGKQFKKALCGKGNPPTCAVPLCQACGLSFTPLWRFGRVREFRPLRRATADRGGSDELLKKLEQNFHQTAPWRTVKLQFIDSADKS